ncbi:hypothetical protein EI427_17815 [Flammeovirga pectinis]|uniref:Uncharacterized protein n=2 Tax=Flammeovirga pectinis TaxID=2494373 RepID=A0A3Q9FTD6_9BACT|nr:hypothetical protein EI427_17815 [Flammeovirga pectinis]
MLKTMMISILLVLLSVSIYAQEKLVVIKEPFTMGFTPSKDVAFRLETGTILELVANDNEAYFLVKQFTYEEFKERILKVKKADVEFYTTVSQDSVSQVEGGE